jgi:CspA family cold shock protein
MAIRGLARFYDFMSIEEASMTHRSTVKWFDRKKGFGFIIGPEGQDVFVHFSQIQGDGYRFLVDAEPVEYTLVKGDKGWHAETVTATARAERTGNASVGYSAAPSAPPAQSP